MHSHKKQQIDQKVSCISTHPLCEHLKDIRTHLLLFEMRKGISISSVGLLQAEVFITEPLS